MYSPSLDWERCINQTLMNTILTTLFTLFLLASFSSIIAQSPPKLVRNSKQKKNKQTRLIQSEFDLVGGLILVKADLDGTTEKFVFDTGAPHLFLNTKRRNCKKSKQQIVGVGESY